MSNKLTDVAVRNAKPGPKPQRLFDAGGLYLEVSPAGGKLWRFKYRFEGKEKRLALGIYPTTTLAEARERREAARKSLAQGSDPGQAKKEAKAAQLATHETFQSIAEEWFSKHRDRWTESTAETIISRLRADIFPFIGSRPIRTITPQELLTVLRRIEARGAKETARRNRQKCSEIFRYAVCTCRADRDIAADIIGAIPPPPERHFASIHGPEDIGALLRAIDGYRGSMVVRCALKLAPLTFVRPGELRHAEWSEINFETAQWHIPAEKMKMGQKHIVPLSRQALEVLKEIFPLTGTGKYVFPGARSRSRPMSENAVLAALRAMGYESGVMTGHGFRSMADTLLSEHGWKDRAIDRQLAHKEPNKVKRAYNCAEYLPIRRRMMQAWADFLDCLRAGEVNATSRGNGKNNLLAS